MQVVGIVLTRFERYINCIERKSTQQAVEKISFVIIAHTYQVTPINSRPHAVQTAYHITVIEPIESIENLTIVATQSVPCGNPQKAVIILRHIEDDTVRQAVLRRIHLYTHIGIHRPRRPRYQQQYHKKQYALYTNLHGNKLRLTSKYIILLRDLQKIALLTSI